MSEECVYGGGGGGGIKRVVGGEEGGVGWGGVIRGGWGLLCGGTWLHVVPAAGLAAAAWRPTLTGVVGLLAWTVHVLLHTLYPLGRAGHTHTHTHTHRRDRAALLTPHILIYWYCSSDNYDK